MNDNMEPPILLPLTVGLIAWAFLSLGAAVAGLYFPPKKMRNAGEHFGL